MTGRTAVSSWAFHAMQGVDWGDAPVWGAVIVAVLPPIIRQH
jgi:hypothetical protein